MNKAEGLGIGRAGARGKRKQQEISGGDAFRGNTRSHPEHEG